MLDYGIEIEFIAPVGKTRTAVAALIEAAGVPCYDAGYSHAFERTKWKLVSDGSIQGGNGMELVSPPLTEANFDQIEKVSAVLLQLGATVNRSCGLHVHVGARTHSVATLKKLAALYIENEPVIDQLLPASRRGSQNNYCQSVAARANLSQLAGAQSVNAIAAAVQQETRYVKLNFQAFWRHGTVEFRHHSGTVEAAKIIKWIVFCSKLVEVAVREANEPIRTPVGSTDYVGYWNSGKRTRTIFRLLTQPEGATAEEVRVALGVTNRPNIPWRVYRIHSVTAGAPAQGSTSWKVSPLPQRTPQSH